jgi:hypothetical protein
MNAAMVATSEDRREQMKIKIETECQPDAAGGTIEWMTDSAKAAIDAALDQVNGTATAFTVHYANDVYHVALRAERHLKDHAVPESDRGGATVTYRPAGPYANAYKNSAISTTVTLTRAGSGFWYRPTSSAPRSTRATRSASWSRSPIAPPRP